jgi:hypothetical protein
MRRHTPLVLMATLLIAADNPKEDPAKKELSTVQGPWVLV